MLRANSTEREKIGYIKEIQDEYQTYNVQKYSHRRQPRAIYNPKEYYHKQWQRRAISANVK